MRSDARIVLETMAEYWNDPKFLSDEYPEPQYNDDQVALVRAGRLAEREVTKALLETIRGDLAGPATTISFLAAEDSEGDCVRWSDVERIFDARIAELEGEDGK